MSDSQEKSDDLIAELAKLMASTAGNDGAPKPSVIKLPPLSEATIKAAPVRIPGMDAPRPAPAESPGPAIAPISPAVPAVRIPGMEKPAGLDSAPLTAPQPRPITQFDFGRPPAPAPALAPEPMTNWQTATPPKLSPAPPPRPAAVAQLAEMKFDPIKPIVAEASRPAATRAEPAVSAPPSEPAPAAGPPASAAPAPKPASSDSFGFDFGFGTGSQPRHAPEPVNDPIADLIAAGLDSAEDDASDADDDAHDADTDAPEAPEHVEPAPAPQPAVFNKPMPATVAAEVLPNPIAPRPVQIASAKPAAPSQIRPVSITPRSAESDRFSVTPVFGGASARPAPSAPSPQVSAPPQPSMRGGDSDPMEEIESLIGEAVRVELSGPEKPIPAVSFPPQPAPVVPPLNSGFAPRRANMRDSEPEVQSAEAAILAAAAASGAEVDRVDIGDDRPYKRMKVKPPRTSSGSSGARQYVGIAVAGTLLLAAGFGLYWVIGMGRDDPSNAPVLIAEEGVTKVQPTIATADTSAAQSGSVVFNEINGTSALDSGETLVSRDETAGATAADVAAVVAEADTSGVSESGLANRKVRTVTVRPDGTIVSGDEAVAGAEELPVARPNVPEIEGSRIEPSELLTAVAGIPSDPAPAGIDPIAALVDRTAAATTVPLTDPAPLDVAAIDPAAAASVTPATFDASIVAPIPMPRPFDRDSLVGNGGRPAASADSAIAPASTPLVAIAQEQPAAAAPVASGGSGAYVQLSSQPTESDAARSLRTTQQRMSGMLNGAQLEIRRVDLGTKGIWYRVVLPVNSFRDATQTCASIKSNGGDCVAING